MKHTHPEERDHEALEETDLLSKAERKLADVFPDDAAMASSLDRFVRLYEHAIAKLLKELVERMLDDETPTTIVKAAMPRKPLLTATQIHELAERIRDYHNAIVLSGVGPAALPPAEVERLITMKILPPEARSVITDAYLYGALLAELRTLRPRTARRSFSYDDFVKRVMKRPPPLTDHEQAAMTLAQMNAATYVRGLGNKVAADFTTTAIEADRRLAAKYRGVIKDAVSEGVERRKTVRQIASDIGTRTNDWARDIRRIAATEKQRAMQEGFKNRLLEREGGDPLVAKLPSPDACEHCVRLHLTAGKGSKPRIFKLSALEQNGSNVGRKTDQWRAVVGPVHPWCACELIHVPEGWGFNDDGDLVPNRLRKGWRFERDLMKALSYEHGVPEVGVTVRVGDPTIVAAIEEVLKRTPPVLFSHRTGITLITSDYPGQNSHLDHHDFAYWTGNEIRLMQTIKPERVKSVLEHEIGHCLNVYLMQRFGSVESVREWHDKLFAIAKDEGFVSQYASTQPIENAAEVSKLYIYDRAQLAKKAPQQFRFVHRYYRDLFDEPEKTHDALGWTIDADIDSLTAHEFYARFDHAASAHSMTMVPLPNGARIYTLGDSTKPTLALLAGLHGEERAGPIALMRWLEDTATSALVPEGTSLWICPLFSCEGWETVRRTPGNVDFNDVWMPGQSGRDESVKAAETSLRTWRPKIFLDLHEDASIMNGKGFIYGYEKDAHFAPALARSLACRVVRWKGSDKNAIGASETFVRGLGCKYTATVETSQSRPLRERVEFQIDAIRFAAGDLDLEAK